MSEDVANTMPAWTPPDDVEPYQHVKLCGNPVIDTPILFLLKGIVQPLVIGRGRVPRVWLSAPTDYVRLEWRFVVSDNVSLHPAFGVTKAKGDVTIRAGGVIVLKVITRASDEIEVTELNLRPVGLDIYGDSSVLKVGRGEIRESSFRNGRAAIGID